MTRVDRYIAVYDKTDDREIDKVPLSTTEFEEIRNLLGFDRTHPMYECYPLQGTLLFDVFALLQGRLNPGDYEYFLESEAN